MCARVVLHNMATEATSTTVVDDSWKRRNIISGVNVLSLASDECPENSVRYMLHSDFTPTLDDHRTLSNWAASTLFGWRPKNDDACRVTRWHGSRYVIQERIGVPAEVWMPTANLEQAWHVVRFFCNTIEFEYVYSNKQFMIVKQDFAERQRYVLLSMRVPLRSCCGTVDAELNAFELVCAVAVAYELSVAERNPAINQFGSEHAPQCACVAGREGELLKMPPSPFLPAIAVAAVVDDGTDAAVPDVNTRAHADAHPSGV